MYVWHRSPAQSCLLFLRLNNNHSNQEKWTVKNLLAFSSSNNSNNNAQFQRQCFNSPRLWLLLTFYSKHNSFVVFALVCWLLSMPRVLWRGQMVKQSGKKETRRKRRYKVEAYGMKGKRRMIVLSTALIHWCHKASILTTTRIRRSRGGSGTSSFLCLFPSYYIK
jgi:hypothetical protein